MTISKRLHANKAKTFLSADITTGSTSISVVDGSIFPQPGAGEYFLITLEYGPKTEIVKVTGRAGNTLTGCVRGQEGGAAQVFPTGARVENRVTADTLSRYEKVVDTLKEIDSIELLDLPVNSNSTTYICRNGDSSGNPIIAVRQNDSTWRFSTHSTVPVQGSATTGTKVGLSFSSLIGVLNNMLPGKYIIQFTTGSNKGSCRIITGFTVNSLTWATPLANDCAGGDQFDIYVSDASVLTDAGSTSNNTLIAALGNRSKLGFLYFMGNF
jgi:hypothetical protein